MKVETRGLMKMETSCIGIELEIKVTKEEAEKTCKRVNQRAELATLTTDEVAFIKRVVKSGTKRS